MAARLISLVVAMINKYKPYNKQVLKAISDELDGDYFPPNPRRVVNALRDAGYHIVSTPEFEFECKEYEPRFAFDAKNSVHIGMDVDDIRLSYSHRTHYTDFRALDWLTSDMARRVGFELMKRLIDEA